MVRDDIFSFNDPVLYLKSIRTANPQNTSRETNLSSSQWAKRLGYKSRRGIGMILSGERLPSPMMLERISRYLHHTLEEHRYLTLLFQLKRRGITTQEKVLISNEMGFLRARRERAPDQVLPM